MAVGAHHDLGLRLVVMMMDNLLLRGRRVLRLLSVLRLLRVLNRHSLGNGTAGRGGRGHHHVERLASSQPLRDNDLHQARRRLHPEWLAAAHTLRHLHPHLRHRGLDDRLGDRLAHNWIHGHIAEAAHHEAGGMLMGCNRFTRMAGATTEGRHYLAAGRSPGAPDPSRASISGAANNTTHRSPLTTKRRSYARYD